MPAVNTPILSFSGGEVDQQALVRVDLTQGGPATTGETLENVLVTVRGAMSKAPGTRYLGEIAGAAASRLWPFVASQTQSYALQLTSSTLKVILNNGYVQLGGGDGAIGGAGDASAGTTGDPGANIGGGGDFGGDGGGGGGGGGAGGGNIP